MNRHLLRVEVTKTLRDQKFSAWISFKKLRKIANFFAKFTLVCILKMNQQMKICYKYVSSSEKERWRGTIYKSIYKTRKNSFKLKRGSLG